MGDCGGAGGEGMVMVIGRKGEQEQESVVSHGRRCAPACTGQERRRRWFGCEYAVCTGCGRMRDTYLSYRDVYAGGSAHRNAHRTASHWTVQHSASHRISPHLSYRSSTQSTSITYHIDPHPQSSAHLTPIPIPPPPNKHKHIHPPPPVHRHFSSPSPTSTS